MLLVLTSVSALLHENLVTIYISPLPSERFFMRRYHGRINILEQIGEYRLGENFLHVFLKSLNALAYSCQQQVAISEICQMEPLRNFLLFQL